MSSIQTWQTFLAHSLATRLDPETFSSYVQILSTKHPLPPSRVSDLFLRPTENNTASLDPRIPRYVQVLLGLELVTVPSILRALWKYSSYGALNNGNGANKAHGDGTGNESESQKREKERTQRWTNSYAAEEMLFYRLAKHVSSGTAPKDIQGAVELILICIQWMDVVTSANQSAHEMLNLATSHTEDMSAQTMALGTLLVAVVENGQVLRALSKGSVPKGTGKELSKTLGNFVPLLLQGSPQSAARLEVFRTQTLVAVEPVEKKEKEVVTGGEIDDILDEGMGLGIESVVVQDLPTANSRAGLYIYLNALLVGRPLMDDNAIFAYLHNRYQGDIQSTITDLILAAFDVLANATFRNENAQATTILRSFLINKIPLLLTTLSASLFPPLTSEYCITDALNHVDNNAFPTLSDMFGEASTNNNIFSDSVRSDFCFACCLHGLIAESSIETLLGDVPMQSLPAGGRYVKDELVQQCLSDPERAEGLIDELEHMNGNVGAVSQAITVVIGRLCSNKETMSLKSLCSRLVKKPSSLDVMLLFDKATTILQPICELLDNWRYEDDQGEYQPVYEEFGSILLLVLSFTHRYSLSTVDLGIRTPDSFVAKLLNQGHLSRAMDELTPQEQNHLDGWIRGLFDNESGGLGDELMSSCPPQDFYLLIPTLFHHIVLACSTKNLSDESLKGGLEYLVDTFLLPSLIPGITWLSSHLWESRGDANAVLQILSALITNPASISNNTEASQMLNSILNIVAKNLEHSLRWLQRAEPTRQDVEPLSKALRTNLGWERRGASDHTELESWTATPGGGLTVTIRQTVLHLVQWGLNPGINNNPANYTHRQIHVGVKILGAKRLLQSIIDEVKTQTESGNGSVVVDVASSLICAPDPTSWDSGLGGTLDMLSDGHTTQALQRRINLREALKNEVDTAPKVHKTDPFQAETLIRLYRKVEAQLTMPQQDMLVHDALGALDTGLDSAGLDAGALDGAIADVSMSGLGGDGLGDGSTGLGGMDGIGGVGGIVDDDFVSVLGADGMGDLFGADLDDGMGF